MAFKRKNSNATEPVEQRSEADYYKLKSKAVDDLINANEENSPVVTPEDLEKYSSRKNKLTLPEWGKAVLIKLWFAGAVCFFIFWGLGTYIANELDMLFIIGVVLGMVTDLLVNNIFRFYAKTPGANDRWMMFPKKGFSSFFFNIIYSMVILACVFYVYNIINMLIVASTGTDTVPLGVEPILFGTLCTAFDMLFIGIKRTFIKIVNDAKKSVK